jgi:hypothetical protein
VQLCPPQTPHAARTRTRAAAVGSQRLTAWATARPIIIYLLICLFFASHCSPFLLLSFLLMLFISSLLFFCIDLYSFLSLIRFLVICFVTCVCMRERQGDREEIKLISLTSVKVWPILSFLSIYNFLYYAKMNRHLFVSKKVYHITRRGLG